MQYFVCNGRLYNWNFASLEMVLAKGKSVGWDNKRTSEREWKQ